jgi:HAD superfamily hydrolase (TIGR01509 family)
VAGAVIERRPPEPVAEHGAAETPAPGTPSAPGPRGVTLDGVSGHWRIVLIAAQDALAAIGRGGTSLRFPAHELRERASGLERERAVTAKLLDDVARTANVALHHRLSAPRATRRSLGLPDGVAALVFDLDGVLTASDAVHAAAWREAFDGLLATRVERTGERFAPFRPYDPRTDYELHLHGRPRIDGVHAFLASRGIRIRTGRADDPPGVETVYGLANRKNAALLELLDREGVAAYEGSLRYLEGAHEAGLGCVVVSASANTRAILARAGLDLLIEECVDGDALAAERLRAKPAPDSVLAACRRLDVLPDRAAAFETTDEGIEAARAAGFGFVVAVDRHGRADSLRAHGADVVVDDLDALVDPALAL